MSPSRAADGTGPMEHEGYRGAVGAGAGSAPGFSGARVLVASCACVATAAYLGAAWLRTPIFGLPTGVWAVGIVQGMAVALEQRRRRRAAAVAAGAEPLDLASWDVGVAAGRALAWGVDAMRHAAACLGGSPERLVEAESKVCGWLDRGRGRVRPAVIGVDAPAEFTRALTQAGPAGARWVSVTAGFSDEASLRRHGLDALVRVRAQGPVRILTPEQPGREAAWYDPSSARPLTFASVFPTRLDPAQITLEDVDPSDRAEVQLTAALAHAAAVLSRAPARLGLADRLRGRRPWPADADGAGAVHAAMRAVADLLIQRRGNATPARRAAARLVSAWVSTAESWVDMNLRRSAVEAALSVVGDEPEVLLRAAAVRLAACDDRAGIDALRRAYRAIRSSAPDGAVDHHPFLQAEVELGLPGPMTLGRVAAGICLVAATSPPSRFAFIRGDVMDDARYSAWLVGRDQDRAALVEIFNALGEMTGETERRRAA